MILFLVKLKIKNSISLDISITLGFQGHPHIFIVFFVFFFLNGHVFPYIFFNFVIISIYFSFFNRFFSHFSRLLEIIVRLLFYKYFFRDYVKMITYNLRNSMSVHVLKVFKYCRCYQFHVMIWKQMNENQ